MAKANVLIVDPSARSVAKLTPLLRSRGHRVIVCETPMDALHEFNQQITCGTPFTFVLCRDDLGPDGTYPEKEQRYQGTDLLRAFNFASGVLPVPSLPVFIGGCTRRGSWQSLSSLMCWFEEIPLLGNSPDDKEWNLDAVTSIMDILGYRNEDQPLCLLPA